MVGGCQWAGTRPPHAAHQRALHEIHRRQLRDEGRADTLLKLLALEFGPLDDSTKCRIASASLEELDRFTERVLFAPTLDEVLS